MVLLPRVGVDPLPNCFGRLRDTQKISKTETRLSDLIDRPAQLGDGVRGHGAVAAKRRRAHVPVVLAGLARQIIAQRKPPRDRPGWFGSCQRFDQCAAPGSIIPRSRRPRTKSCTATAVRRTPKTISDTTSEVGLIRLAILSMLLKIR